MGRSMPPDNPQCYVDEAMPLENCSSLVLFKRWKTSHGLLDVVKGPISRMEKVSGFSGPILITEIDFPIFFVSALNGALLTTSP